MGSWIGRLGPGGKLSYRLRKGPWNLIWWPSSDWPLMVFKPRETSSNVLVGPAQDACVGDTGVEIPAISTM